MAKKDFDNEDGVWRTIGGRRIFIKNGQDLSTAMKESGKFHKNLWKPADKYTESERREFDKVLAEETSKKASEDQLKRMQTEYKDVADLRDEYEDKVLSKVDEEERKEGKLKQNNDAENYYSKLSEKEIKEDLEERKNRLDNDFYDKKDKEMYQKFYDEGKKYYDEKYKNKNNKDDINSESKFMEKRRKEIALEREMGVYDGERHTDEKGNYKYQKELDEKEKTTNDIMNKAIRDKASKKSEYKEDLPKKTEIKEQGTSNRKEVSENIQAHILDYYTPDYTGDDSVSASEAFMRQMEAMGESNMWNAGKRIAEGGSYLIYNGDMADFLNELKINPKGKTFSEDKAFDMYTSLVGRESAKLYERLQKNAYNKYMKEHPLSNMSFNDFKDMRKK